MPVTHRHMAPGDWEVTFDPDMPASVRRLFEVRHHASVGDPTARDNIGWSTLVVTPAHVEVEDIPPEEAGPDALPHGVLRLAEWSGLVWAADRATPSLSGLGLAAYLGVGSAGDLWLSAAQSTAGARTPACHVTIPGWAWVDWMIRGGTKSLDHPILGAASVSVAVRPSGLGFIQAGSGAGEPMWWRRNEQATRMEVVTRACVRSGWEWEVTPAGRFRFGAPADMWPSTQTPVVIGPGLTDDPAHVVIDGRVDRWETSLDGWQNRAWTTGVWPDGYGTEGYEWVRSSDTGGGGYRRLWDGGVVQWGQMVPSGETRNDEISDGDWLSLATGGLIETVTPGRYWIAPEIRLSGGLARRHGTVRRPSIRPGMRALLWDPRVGATDPTRTAVVGGETIHPTEVRISSVTRPLRPGQGVYLLRRTGASTTALVDLTRWAVPDDDADTVSLEVGAPSPPLAA